MSGASADALRTRHRLLHAIRAFFDGSDFVEVETPALVRSPGNELHIDALEVLGADPRRWLIPSPELHMKRLLGDALPRIYQLARCFRRGEVGDLHQPEFTMLEWYRAHAGSADVMADTERLVSSLASELGEGVLLRDGVRVDVTPPWERLTVAEAFQRHASVALEAVVDDDDAFYRTLVDEVEPALGRERATFLTHYPARMASLARLNPDDPSTADRFEAYVAGIELCNGFGELVDTTEQRSRFEAERAERVRLGKVAYPIDERFLDALDGLPESGGNALGVDRLLMLLLGAERISDVVAFPHDDV